MLEKHKRKERGHGSPGRNAGRQPAQLLPENKAARCPQGPSGHGGRPQLATRREEPAVGGLGAGRAGGAEVCAPGGGALGSLGQGRTTPCRVTDSTGYFGPLYSRV